LLGITIDPQFTENHYVYTYYTSASRANNNGSDSPAPFNRVVRFTDVDNVGRNMTVILDNIPANPYGMHAGGALTFGPDGKLYVTVGNAYIPIAAQDKGSLLGKVLRINKDGSVPQDNPFPGNPVYTLGHRNMYGIAIDPHTARGIVTENGDDYYDEINPLVAGGNYGYPTAQMPNKAPELSQNDSAIKPLRSYWKTIAPTQAIFYQGDKFAELDGKFVVGSYNNGRLYAFKVNSEGQAMTLKEELKVDFPIALTSNIIALAESPSGDIYYGGYYIYKLNSLDSESRKPAFAPVTASLLRQNLTTEVSLTTNNNSDTDTGYKIAGITFDRVNAMLAIDLEKQSAEPTNVALTTDAFTSETPSTEFGSNVASNGDEMNDNSTTLQPETQNIILKLAIDKQILQNVASVTVSEERGDQDLGEHAVGFTSEVETGTENAVSGAPIVVSIPIVLDKDTTGIDISIK
jgi:hypothetical protein